MDINSIENQRTGEIFSPNKNNATIAVLTKIKLPNGDKTLISSFDKAPSHKNVANTYKQNPPKINLLFKKW